MSSSDEGDADSTGGFAAAGDRVQQISGGLTFTQAQLNAVLGSSLADLYQELVLEPLPESLKALLDRLEAKDHFREANNELPKPLAAS